MSFRELPVPVTDDLFNLECLDVEMAASHLADEIERYGFATGETTQKGVMVMVGFSNKTMTGTLTVNRLERVFSIEARGVTGGVFLPIGGCWRDVCRYLANLQREST